MFAFTELYNTLQSDDFLVYLKFSAGNHCVAPKNI